MATTMTQEDAGRGTAGRAAGEGRFFIAMAVACAAIAILGFAPGYWVPLATGSIKANPAVHLHGFIFSAWALFFVFQVWLAESRQFRRHRTMGLISVSFTTLMIVFGAMAAINLMKSAAAVGQAEAGRAFAIVPLGGILFFASVFAWAAANVRHTDWHKRLMLVAAISILDAPIARVLMLIVPPPAGAVGPPPVAVDIVPSIVTLLMISFAAIYDWRTRGALHPAYLWSGGALLVVKLLQGPISGTAAWHAVAGAVLGLG